MDGPKEQRISVTDPTIRKIRAASSPDISVVLLPSVALQARYEDLKRIGEGSMGTVYRGWDPRLGRAVALKLLKSDAPSDTRRFLAEARAQARVQHENVCRVYEVGDADGEPYIAMELIEGLSLDRAHVGMTLEQKVKVIREVAAALHEAHRLGLIHRDVKPSNIMVVTTEDGLYKPYVVDFGLARDASSSGVSTQNGIVGTPAYMSPEQALGTAMLLDRRTDVYSLGATLYDIVAGRTPFVDPNALTLLTKVMYEDAPALGSVWKGVPRQLETIVMTCLERDPERRYESARALGEDLQRFLDGGIVQAKRPPISYVLWQKAKRHKALVVVTVIGFCIAVILGGMWIRSAQQATKQAELARELGEDVKYVELFLRSAYGFPAHDMERELKVVRTRLTRIEQRMREAGPTGEGPGHYALGRAHLALHEYEAARTHLEQALSAGYTKPEVHYSLGIALGGRYQEELDAARRIEDPTAREGSTKAAESKFRDPALDHLRQSNGTDFESRVYIDGIIALYEKRYEDAANQARTAITQSPWLYEAHKLEGDALLESGIAAGERGDRENARVYFSAAVTAYQTGAEMGRSDEAIHQALAETWIQILILDTWAGRSYNEAFNAALSACDTAIKNDPRSAKPHARKERAYFHVGNHQLRSGADPRKTLEKAIESGLIAHQLDPNDAIAMDALGNSRSFIAEYERKIGIDPRPTLVQARLNFDEATRIQPSFAWAWNDAGIAVLVMASYEDAHGINPQSSVDSAIERFERAVRENVAYALAYGNMIYGYTIRANYETSQGIDPHSTVKRAIESAERGAKVDAKWLPLLNNRGWAELVAAQYEENTNTDPSTTLDRVEASFQASLDINKDEADTQFGMGSAKHVRALDDIRRNVDPQKHIDEARAFLEKAAQLDAQEPGIRQELGQLFLTMARYAIDEKRDPIGFLNDAERVVREGLRVNARHAPLHTTLAEVLAMRAEHVEKEDAVREKLITDGLAAADEALAVNPKWALAMATKGTQYAIRAGMRKDAERAEDIRVAIEWLNKGLAINALLPSRFKTRLQALQEAKAELEPQPTKAL